MGPGPGGDPPSRRGVTRVARLAAVPAAHAGRSVLGLGQRLGGRPAEVVAGHVQQRTAEQLFATLGQLKGGAMKVGQAMSAMEAAFPEQLVTPYREALVRLQDAAPAMPASVVHAQLDRSFPAGWQHLFRAFDDRPVAAASIGQVHRAVFQDGSDVAVKVQYPGAGDALRADLRLLERLAPLIRAAVPGLDAKQLVRELHDRVVEEVDYVLEADAQSAFHEAYDGDDDLCVPEVLVVEDAVLVTRWIEGRPLSRVIEDGTQDERDRAGLLLLRLLLSSPVRARRLHGDPHPGNFRLLADGRLAVLDFGATEQLPGGWPGRLGEVLAAGRDGDAQRLHALLSATGAVGRRGVTPAALQDLLDPYLEPLRQPSYAFSRAWLQEQTRRASDPRTTASRTQRQLSIPPHHLLLQRVAMGLAGVLCSLRAVVPVDAEVARWVPGYAATGG
jgi:predicted unusual protein kinase regulating ubiquinone biosynthesis (AarF/ABC1/UbiB family)